MNKLVKIIAGPNGSGKTTFAEIFINKLKPAIPFLNPDLIAAGLGPSSPEKASYQAGKILLTEIKSKIEKGESFAFETTLSGLTYALILENAKKNGYRIEIYFIFLNKITLNFSRIKKRVLQGGHDIPREAVKRRHLKCFNNFWQIYRSLADDWIILNNSTNKPSLVMDKSNFIKLPNERKTKFENKFLIGKIQ